MSALPIPEPVLAWTAIAADHAGWTADFGSCGVLSVESDAAWDDDGYTWSAAMVDAEGTSHVYAEGWAASPLLAKLAAESVVV